MIVIPFADPGLDESERILDLYQHFLDEAPYIVQEALQAFQDLADRNWAPTRVPVPEAYATQEGDQTLLAVRSFVEDCVLYAADSQVSTEELYDAYREHAFDEGSRIEQDSLWQSLILGFESGSAGSCSCQAGSWE